MEVCATPSTVSHGARAQASPAHTPPVNHLTGTALIAREQGAFTPCMAVRGIAHRYAGIMTRRHMHAALATRLRAERSSGGGSRAGLTLRSYRFIVLIRKDSRHGDTRRMLYRNRSSFYGRAVKRHLNIGIPIYTVYGIRIILPVTVGRYRAVSTSGAGAADTACPKACPPPPPPRRCRTRAARVAPSTFASLACIPPRAAPVAA
jgi:hypothetical protein